MYGCCCGCIACPTCGGTGRVRPYPYYRPWRYYYPPHYVPPVFPAPPLIPAPPIYSGTAVPGMRMSGRVAMDVAVARA